MVYLSLLSLLWYEDNRRSTLLLIQTEPTSGNVQAGVELRLMCVFAAELSAEFLKGSFSLSESRLQAADPLHVLLC